MSRAIEAQEVLDHCAQALAEGRRAALAILAEVHGSAYRRPGAKMMFAENQEMHGQISGGCLESDVYLQAEHLMRQGRSALISIDLASPEVWSLGIGCEGRVDILVVPTACDDAFWSNSRSVLASGLPLTWILEIPEGTKAGIDRQGRHLGDDIPEAVRLQAEADGPTEIVAIGGRRYLLDRLVPAPVLVLCGAGDDARPVADLARSVGFSVTVLDPRPEFNHRDRFPRASRLLVMEPPNAFGRVSPSAFWVVMNHHLSRDQASLDLALASDPIFVGMLGPYRRTRDLLDRLGRTFADGPIISPAGLDLGAETPEEVALSIVSQLLAYHRQRPAGPLHGCARIHSSAPLVSI